jgi:hypothetical protein
MLVFVVLGAAAGGTLARADVVRHRPMRLAPASHVVLRGSVHQIGVAPTGFLASGDYVLFSTGSNPAWVLIDDRLGTTTALDPQCPVVGLGPPWVLCQLTSAPFGTTQDVELYSLAGGTRQTVTLSPGMPYCSSPPVDPEVDCRAEAVGAYWIEWVGSSYHHLPTEVYFQNIQTGELRGDPTNATTFADLDSPALAQTTCPGVRLMRVPAGYGSGSPWGPLTPLGQFAVAIGSEDQGNPAAFLEHCGTGLRRLLSNGVPASNRRAIVWQAATPNRLNGLFLPSLQTFTIPLPSAVVTATGLSGIWLTSRALYLRVWESGTLWRTASPTALPLNTSRPRLTRSGSTLTCRRGSWRKTVRFSYAWRVNGRARQGARKPRLTLGKARQHRRVSCSVTTSNAAGTTTASSAPLHMH